MFLGSLWPPASAESYFESYRVRFVNLTTSLEFRLERPLHQLPHRLERTFSFVQDPVHLLDDRHLDAEFLRDQENGARVGNPFGDHAGAARDFLELFAAGDLQAGAAVAAQIAGRGQDEIAEARKARERRRIAPHL